MVDNRGRAFDPAPTPPFTYLTAVVRDGFYFRQTIPEIGHFGKCISGPGRF